MDAPPPALGTRRHGVGRELACGLLHPHSPLLAPPTFAFSMATREKQVGASTLMADAPSYAWAPLAKGGVLNYHGRRRTRSRYEGGGRGRSSSAISCPEAVLSLLEEDTSCSRAVLVACHTCVRLDMPLRMTLVYLMNSIR